MAQGNDTGSANAYVVATNPAITSYLDKLSIRFTAANTNTGAATININGMGPVSIIRYDGTPLVANDIPVGAVMDLKYSVAINSFQVSGVGPQGTTGQPGASPADYLLYAQGII
ncbi:hypothetical protein [Undibacterium sp.]|uniref:hypothetical protein n=1 Tax=Undibacterium sp. TaxID=1914977 RepID=UPI00374CED48